MSSEKPKTETKHPHRESHVPKEKKPKKHRLRNALLGVAAAAGMAGLAGGCAPSARAQETTPRQTPAVAVTPTTRVAGAETSTERRPYPPTVVAQATPLSTNTVGYDQAAAGSGSASPHPEWRSYGADVPGVQPEVLTGEQFRNDYGYTFSNSEATVTTLPNVGTLTMGDWEVHLKLTLANSSDIIIRNRNLNFEESFTVTKGSRVTLLPFPETDYARGPMLVITDVRFTLVYFFNKISNCVTNHYVTHGIPSGIPEIGTEIFEGKPYIYIAPTGSLTSNADMLPGTRFYMYALLSTTRDGDGPGATTNYFERGSD